MRRFGPHRRKWRHDTAISRTETLIPDDLRAALIVYGRASEEQEDFDPRLVVKLFTPDGSATWLITEAYEETDGICGSSAS